MTQILAVPDFAHGQGFLTDVKEVVRSIGSASKRLVPCFKTVSGDCQEVRFGVKPLHVTVP